MDFDILKLITSFAPMVITAVVFYVIYYLVKNFLDSQRLRKNTNSTVVRSIILFLIFLFGFISVILAYPMADGTRGQIANLVGIVISGVLAWSSATFIGNAFAGIMIRIIDNFKPGDFIAVNDIFGKVSERGLFHTEIQLDNSDLITVPNIYLASNPVQVTRYVRTFISTTCSLGYDVNRSKIEKALLEAAKKAGLEEAFVLITELGDYSVVYKIQGLLKNVNQFLTAKSKLNAMVLDELHAANIEIVSPSFMNQRQVGDTVFIPKKNKHIADEQITQDGRPEESIFDKAFEAASIEQKKEKILEIDATIQGLNDKLKASKSDEEKAEYQTRINRWNQMKEKLETRLKNEGKA